MGAELINRIAEIVEQFWSGEFNMLGLSPEEQAWKKPDLAVAAGADPLFRRLKSDIGSFYWTPEDAFSLAFPGAVRSAEELSVVSWILPQTDLTRQEQRRQTQAPGKRWAGSRFYGEAFNYHLRLHLANSLCAMGIPAVGPECLPGYSARCHSDRFGISSNWSERHVAWVAGHGTFGLSDGLITRHGKAVRFGSVVVAARLPVTPRSYQGYQDWCLYFTKGTCGACIDRCPADAITRAGHDKDRCLSYITSVTTPYVNTRYGTGATPCGLCQAGIPCEAKIPSSLRS